ncbi:GNAT family N-acetyltransferase [Enterococcus alishanensis]|uniref:GNAT family N-acetyltransferase n=1 Tax=Enterococcus alishanensis TaxID=1303817 RepID=A0ABS6T997_9ENTE|nr:GNAT family N-acetyltransferase [Enterococcus alishanensis]MBV7389474.1 GNAT family N-acetyltransferase [Enterococcus alishanensis]
MDNFEVIIREAIPKDAAEILAFTNIVNQETDFIVVDELGIELTEELLAINLESIYESENNILLVAEVNGMIVGNASVKASSEAPIRHVGEVGMSIFKDFWGMGLGTILLEEIIAWSEETEVIYRLELTVQERNQRAIHLYQKLGFKEEASLERGTRSNDGEFLTVLLMSKMIN